MSANGVVHQAPEQAPGAEMLPGRLTRSRADRQPILSLVDREYLKSTANIPRGMWEPMSYLYSEADKSIERIDAMEIPETEEELEKLVSELRIIEKTPAKEPLKAETQPWLKRIVNAIAGRSDEPVPAPAPAPLEAPKWIPASKAEQDAARAYWRAVMQTKDATIKQWHQAIGWLDELLIQSASVEALRSWQLMTGLQQANGDQRRPSAAIMPDFPQPRPPGQKEEKRRGLHL